MCKSSFANGIPNMRANFTTRRVMYRHSFLGVGTSNAGSCAMEAQKIVLQFASVV